MENVFTSYFYNVRFLKPWQVPVSTACFDPAWFHDFKGKSWKFIDGRGVINGLRAEFLHPDSTCDGLCRGRETCTEEGPESCKFLKAYEAQLSAIGKEKLQKWAEKLLKKLQAEIGDGSHQVQLVLLVHEPPYRECSERKALQRMFGCQELNPEKAAS